MENTAHKNEDVSALAIIAEKSKRNKFFVTTSSIISFITELLCYLFFLGLLVLAIFLPLNPSMSYWSFSAQLNECCKNEIILLASKPYQEVMIASKIILTISALGMLFVGILLRKVRNRNTTISDINKLAEQALKVIPPKSASAS